MLFRTPTNRAARLVACLGLLAFTQCSPATGAAESASAPAIAEGPCLPVTGVYPSWRHQAYGVERIDWRKLDVVATGFVLPRPDGSLNTDGVTPYLRQLVTDAHAHNDQVYVLIGGAAGVDDAFQQISRDPAARARFVAEVAAFARTHGVDGIDIDWEYWTWQQKLGKGGRDPDESALLVALLRDLRAGLPKEVRLSADIFAGDWTGKQYSPEILQHVDHVNLMAFDFTGAWKESPVAHHSPVDMVGKAVDWSKGNGFPLDKVWLGLPAYGVEFPDGKPLSGRQVPQTEITQRLKDDQEALKRGRSGKLFFDTPADSSRKAAMAASRGMGGVFVFELTSDAPEDGQSLITAARSGLGARACAVD